MKNRNIYLAWLFIIALALLCKKYDEKAQEWWNRPDVDHSASVGYPYHPGQ